MTPLNPSVPPHEYAAQNRLEATQAMPAAVCLDVFGVSGKQVAAAIGRMSIDRTLVRRQPGVTFAKMLGTGSGKTFTSRDADPGHWAILTCWTHPGGPASLHNSATFRGWSTIADEHARFVMLPLASRGTWSARQPFGDPFAHRWDGPIAAITRARIKTMQWRNFWASVPSVSADLHRVDGLTFAMGIGEAPVGLQGTFSTWTDGSSLSNFAHRRDAHQDVMRMTHEIDWYAEELFARFALVEAAGSYNGAAVALTSTSQVNQSAEQVKVSGK